MPQCWKISCTLSFAEKRLWRVLRSILKILEPTFLQGEQIGKWCNGAAEDKALIPNGYVGDPKGSQYIETNLKEADRRIARDIVNSFGKRVNDNYE